MFYFFEFVTSILIFDQLPKYIYIYIENLLQRWCVWSAWWFNQSVPHAQQFLANYPWQNITAESANYLMMKGKVALLVIFYTSLERNFNFFCYF